MPTSTPAFSRWFAGSACANDNGVPWVLYHGSKSPEQLLRFIPGGTDPSRRTGDAYGMAAYLTSSPCEASFYAGEGGAVFPVYARGRLLDLQDQPLDGATATQLTRFAGQHLLASDKARFGGGREMRTFDDLAQARAFFDSQRANWRAFGDGLERARPEVVDASKGAFTIEFTNYDAAIPIVNGRDAEILFRTVGWDNVPAAGFDGIILHREGGGIWVVMHRPHGNIKSALGNSGAFDPFRDDIRFSLAPAAPDHGLPRTPAFLAWFGRSQAIDAAGHPLRLYHGSGADTGHVFRPGTFFSPRPDVAALYANAPTRQSDRAGPNIAAVFLSLQNPYVFDEAEAKENLSRHVLGRRGRIEEIIDRLSDAGFDGLILKGYLDLGGVQGQYVIFKPEQAKSATGNQGAFDPANGDVRFSFAGEQALGANAAQLQQAHQRIAAGAPAETVRQDTGWHRGAEGRWRFEISDHAARLVPGALFEDRQLLASQRNEQRAAIVRRLRRLDDQVNRFIGRTFSSTRRGEMHEATREQVLDKAQARYMLDKKKLQSLLDGAEEVTLAPRLQELLVHPALFEAYPVLRRIAVHLLDAGPAPAGAYVVRHAERTGFFEINRQAGEERVLSVLLHEVQHAVQALEGFVPGGSSEQFSSKPQTAGPQRDGASTSLDSFASYRRLAGEVEARNTQARQHLSDNERRQTPPASTADTAPEDLIIMQPTQTDPSTPLAAQHRAGHSLPSHDPRQSRTRQVRSAIARLLGASPDAEEPQSLQLPSGLGGIVVLDSQSLSPRWEQIGPCANRLSRALATDLREVREEGLGNHERLVAAARRSAAQAFFDPRTGTIGLVADRIAAGKEEAVFLHEVTHKHGRAALGVPAWQSLVNQVKAWREACPGSSERAIHDGALQRALASGVDGPVFDEELLAYAVETAIARGVEPSAAAAPHSSERWLAEVVASIERVGEKLTGKRPAGLGHQDIVDLAYALAQLETPRHAERIRQALHEHMPAHRAPGPYPDSAAEPPPAPWWRSALLHAIDACAMKAAAPEQWAAFIGRLPTKGVKPEEIEWSGVQEWLALQPPGNLGHAQLRAYVASHGVRLAEAVLGGPAKAAGFTVPTVYGSYVLPDGQNYRELILFMPTLDKASGATASRLPLQPQRLHLHAADPQRQRLVEQETPVFKSTHWPVNNVLAHVRMNERAGNDGQRVLFIEEIQSDWGQQGKKRGFAGPDTTIDGKTASQWQALADQTFGRWSAQDQAPRQQWEQAVANAQTLREKYQALGLPDVVEIPRAPFVTTTDAWLGLCLKRVIRYAAENAFDSVAFISGQQSVARYPAMATHADRVSVEPAQQPGGFFLHAFAGATEVSRTAKPLSRACLAREIGSPLARRAELDIAAGVQAHYQGLDLQLGGEGMKAFYDKIVPLAAQKILRKLGSSGLLEQRVMVDGAACPQISFPITPALRARTMAGLMLFSHPEEQEDDAPCPLAPGAR